MDQNLSSSTPKHAWAIYLLSFFLLVGVGIGGYLTWHHENELYGDSSVSLNCPESQTINCEVVNSSKYSELFGVPIALFAIPTYLLLLALLLLHRKYQNALGYAFFIGVLTVCYSAFLYVASTVWVGYLCLWCLSLYTINLLIPILISVAIWKNPLPVMANSLKNLRWNVPEMRFSIFVFVGLLAVSLAGQKLYRANLVKVGPSAVKPGEEKMAFQGDEIWKPGEFKVPGKLLLATNPSKGKLSLQEFDISSKIGKGKPVGLVFISPGMYTADRTFLNLVNFAKKEAKNLDLYAVAGFKGEYKPEMAYELYQGFPDKAQIPLLFDPEFEVSKQLGTIEVPALVLIDKEGTLVTNRIKEVDYVATKSPQEITGGQIIRGVASGETQGRYTQYKTLAPYYPSAENRGKCATAFTLNDVMTGKPYRFTGKSSNGKPTLLVFWSSTCKHCQKEIPQLLKNYKENPGKYNIVSVSNIRPDKKDGTSHRRITKAYIQNLGINFPVLADSGAVSNLYGVISTPTTVLISANGTVKDHWYYVHSNMDEAVNNSVRELASATGTCKPAATPTYPKFDLSFVGPDNKQASVAKFSGKPMLLHFWATWCGPCQEELPTLLKFGKEFEQKGGKLVLLSVEEEDSGAKIKAFLQSIDPKWSSFRAPAGGIADKMNVGFSVPRTYLLNEKGEVLKAFYGGQEWGASDFQERVYAWLQK